MGYETNLILLDLDKESKPRIDRDSIYASVVGTMDLCKLPSFGISSNMKKKGILVELYLPGDGNKYVTDDMYGKPLVAYPAKHILKLLRSNPEAKTYRRLITAIPLLRGFVKSFGKYAYVACYGH